MTTYPPLRLGTTGGYSTLAGRASRGRITGPSTHRVSLETGVCWVRIPIAGKTAECHMCCWIERVAAIWYPLGKSDAGYLCPECDKTMREITEVPR